MNKKVKYLVVGGGVSGLMFANLVAEDDFLLVEKEHELGGYCRTIYQDGFVWDYAGHFFHFSNEAIRRFFEERMPADSFVRKEKCTKIVYGDDFIDFPFQMNIHQLKKEEFIDCLYDLYTRDERQSYDSFLGMLYAKFGKSITEKFLRPYNEKLYACDLNLLDKNAMGRFFPHANFDEIVRNFKGKYQGSYNNTFLYPRRGAKAFVEALAKKLPIEKVRLDEEVLSIDPLLKLALTNKGAISYDVLVSSMPLNLLLGRISGGNYQGFIEKMSWNKVLVLNLGFDKGSGFNNLHWAYFPEDKYPFYRVGFYNNILGQDRLSLYVELGYPSSDDVDIKGQLEATLSGLRESGIIRDHNLISWSSVVMNPAYIHVDNGLAVQKKDIKSHLSENDIFSIGRYGDWKYCSIEDSMLDAVEIAKLFGKE